MSRKTLNNVGQQSEIQSLVDHLRVEMYVPGAIVAIFDDSDCTVVCSGQANLSASWPVTRDTVFQIGSVTKLFTTMLAMQLVEAGKLDLDTRVVDVIPDFRLLDDDATASLNIWHLLTHSGGMQGDYYADFGRGDDALARWTAALADLPQITPPGERGSYSNSGLTLLGRVVEVVVGEPWPSALDALLLRPAGLTRILALPEQCLLHPCATPHRTLLDDSGEVVFAPTHRWYGPHAGIPAGGLAAAIDDLTEFARIMLREGRAADGTAILTPETVAMIATPQIEFATPAVSAWGLGWTIWDTPHGRVIGHNGDTIGESAFVRVSLELGTGVIMMCNSAAGWRLFSRVLASLPEDVNPGIRYARATIQAHPNGPADVGAFTGIYDHGSGVLGISPANGGIAATFQSTGTAVSGWLGESEPERYALSRVNETVYLLTDYEETMDPYLAFTGADASGVHQLVSFGGRMMRRTDATPPWDERPS